MSSANQLEEESLSSVEISETNDGVELQYSIEDVPPWYLWILLGFQHYITMVGATIAIPILLSRSLCIEVGTEADEVAKAELIGTIFFVSGLVTFLQCTFGCRLPIVQGGTFAFLPPALAILKTFGPCPTLLPAGDNLTEYNIHHPNVTAFVVGTPEHAEMWQTRMRTIQGAICVSALFQVVVGFSGLIGLLLRFISPVVITPTIALVGLSLFHVAGDYCATQWGISLLTVALLALFSQYLSGVSIPCCKYSREERGCVKAKPYPLFRLFPVILAMAAAYIISMILTYTDVFPDDKDHRYYRARTDSRISVIYAADWFNFPYPGQWGLPTVTVAGVFGMLAGVLASMVESVGDYYAAARLSGAPPPTTAAINRGIGMEGVGCVIAGLWGSGNGTTSYSENIGALGITQVGSRRVIQTGGILMLILGMITKFCAVFVTIPDPIIGGIYIVMFGIVCAVGLSNLQFVNLNSSRNLFIVGLSLLFGLAVPAWLSAQSQKVPPVEPIKTGSDIVDDIFTVLLSTGMFVGGSVAFFLDNTIPGSKKDRGLHVWSNESNAALSVEELRKKYQPYDMPFGNDAIYRAKWTSYIPICPNFLYHTHIKKQQKNVKPNELEDGDGVTVSKL